MGGLMLVMMAAGLLSNRSGTTRTLIDLLAGLLMAGLMFGLLAMSVVLVRRLRADQTLVEGIGEMVQLRRWTEAASQLEHYLGRPSRTLGLRSQALVYLAAILARYQRFLDAIVVYDYLIDHELVDAGTGYALRLGRTMAMLREDHLVDADRALSDLKRMTPPGVDSAGLSLLDLYRDVKTGHYQDAIDRFARVLPSLRQQLGHRTGDAWALAARSYDALGRASEAAQAYKNATLLCPLTELSRRYPEVQKLQGRYEPAFAPTEAA